MPLLNTLRQRALLIQAIRQFFIDRDYLEVETPIRQPSLIPEAHLIPQLSEGWFLQASPELCMKRLLAAGCHKIFQIAKCFRGQERGTHHLPEFTMLEWYRTDSSYLELMDECEDLFISLAELRNDIKPLHKIYRTRNDKTLTIALQKPWQRLTVEDAFRCYASISLASALANDNFDEILCREIEPQLGKGQPTFLYDYPAVLGALARTKKGDPTVAERFEIYIDGIELANGFTELTDPNEQRQRFLAEQEKILLHNRQPGPLPELFLGDLAQLPPCAGIALGVDRLAMIFLDASLIHEVVSFAPENLE